MSRLHLDSYPSSLYSLILSLFSLSTETKPAVLDSVELHGLISGDELLAIGVPAAECKHTNPPADCVTFCN